MTKNEILDQVRIDGNNVYLPDIQLARKLYMEVAAALNLAGGKWVSEKVKAFVFPEDPTDLIARLAGNEKVNLKKEFQYFATTRQVGVHLWALASDNYNRRMKILEPSADQGALIKALHDNTAIHFEIDCYELMPLNRTFLEKIENVNILGNDFLEAEPKRIYDVIVGNLPFSKNQDIDHILHMEKFLAPGGRLVSVASKHWQTSSNKK